MILSFADKTTRDIYNGANTPVTRRIPRTIHAMARRKLDMIRRAQQLTDLKVPPGNHLEALKGDLQGYHSIRINAQYRIIFRWIDGDADHVKIADYH